MFYSIAAHMNRSHKRCKGATCHIWVTSTPHHTMAVVCTTVSLTPDRTKGGCFRSQRFLWVQRKRKGESHGPSSCMSWNIAHILCLQNQVIFFSPLSFKLNVFFSLQMTRRFNKRLFWINSSQLAIQLVSNCLVIVASSKLVDLAQAGMASQLASSICIKEARQFCQLQLSFFILFFILVNQRANIQNGY